MGSLFLVVIPVRSYEFEQRLREHRVYLMPPERPPEKAPEKASEKTPDPLGGAGGSSASSSDDEADTNKKKVRVIDEVYTGRIDASKELRLPKEKDDTKSMFVYSDGKKLTLEVTRDTMKLTVTDKQGMIPVKTRGSFTSGTNIYEGGENISVRGSMASMHDLELKDVINSLFLEKHMEETLTKFSLLNASWDHSIDDKFSQICFTVNADRQEEIINHLYTVGIGKKYESTLSVCTATVFSNDDDGKTTENSEATEENKGKWNNFVQSIKARLTVAQVVQNVKSNAVITFDYIVFVIVAGIIASLGLLEDSSVNLVASMLISPLMGPIMAFTFGAMIRDRALMKVGVVAEILGLSLCLLMGFLFGIFVQAKPLEGPWASVTRWPTSEMYARCQFRSLIVGALIAIPSGAGVALSILAGNAGSLVGVAISASLLPPCVNCGVFYGIALVIAIQEKIAGRSVLEVHCDEFLGVGKPDDPNVDHWRLHPKLYCSNAAREFALMGSISLSLTLLNIVLIFFTGLIVLKVKEVAPYTTKTSFERFWKYDLKQAREYNITHSGENALVTDAIDELNDHRLLNVIQDDFVYNQVKQRIMYRDENLLREAKQKKSKSSVRSAPPPPPKRSWMQWFSSSSPDPEINDD